jgi:26S proteasome regulatory subunit T4
MSEQIDDAAETQPLLPPPTEQEPSERQPQKSAAELRREQAVGDFKRRLIEHREWDAKLKELRFQIRDMEKQFDKTEDDMKALQSVGQIVGEVLKQLDEEKFIVKASSGPRYVVGCRNKVNKAKLKQGARVGISVGNDIDVALDMTTLTIMRMLPREVDPLVFNMSLEDPGQVSFSGIGGLSDQIRELREVLSSLII